MFVGLNDKTNAKVHLLLCLVSIILSSIGLNDLAKLNQKDICNDYTFNLPVLIIIFMCTCLFFNIGIISMPKMNPMKRQKFKRLMVYMRWIVFLLNIIIFSMIVHFTNPFNGCDSLPITLSIVFGTYIILMSIELIIVGGTFLLFLLSLSCVILLWCFGCLQLESEDNSGNNDPGTAHLGRTQVDNLTNTLSKLGMAMPQEGEDELNCGICMEPYDDQSVLRKMPCDHFFHKDCIDQWLSRSSLCPICKQNIMDAESKFGGSMVVDI